MRILLLLFVLLILSSCQRLKVKKAIKLKENHSTTATITANSLYNNVLLESIQQKVNIMLPPSYNNSDKNYPVVYYLHGFYGDYREMNFFTDLILQAMKKKKVEEFILVGVNGHTSLGATFFHNSDVTGNWQDFLIKEVIVGVDENFRTKKEAKYRGLAGFSMGGFGALQAAFYNTELFGGVYALSPMILSDDDFLEAYESWDTEFRNAYGAAFAPYPDAMDYTHYPTFNQTANDSILIKEWVTGIGNWDHKVLYYPFINNPLQNILIEYGKADENTWIPKGCKNFSQILKNSDIPHKIIAFEGSHANKHTERIIEHMLPFFSQQFEK